MTRTQVVDSGAGDKQTIYVAELFNEMVEEYDRLQDLWYRYTFGEIDRVLVQHFRPEEKHSVKPIALDVGCGTGIQSLRLAQLGYKVIGVDIAEDLIEVARKKLAEHGFSDAEFYVENAQALTFPNEFAECVNCCGPVLSFVPNWRSALAEISRCLKPGGKLLLEVEGKWTLDLFWGIISASCSNCLGYGESLKSALEHLLPPWNEGHLLNYSFKLESGESVTMPLRLFSAGELRRELRKVSLIQRRRWSLHVITNLIPSTLLHDANPSDKLKRVFNSLASIERRLNAFWPFNAFGCSLLVIAEKQNNGR